VVNRSGEFQGEAKKMLANRGGGAYLTTLKVWRQVCAVSVPGQQPSRVQQGVEAGVGRA